MPKPPIPKLRIASGPTSRMVSYNVQRLRRLRGWSQTELAQRLTDAGRKMSLSSISEIELGSRRVDVDDLAALAAVLQVTPYDLLLPPVRGTEIECEITGLGVVDTQSAWTWAMGFRPKAWAQAPRGWSSLSSVKRVLSPQDADRQERQQMIDDLLKAADARHHTLAETPGVPAAAVAAAAAEIERLERIDPGDDDYWQSAPYDPARRAEDAPSPTVAEQVARIPGLTELVTVKPEAQG